MNYDQIIQDIEAQMDKNVAALIELRQQRLQLIEKALAPVKQELAEFDKAEQSCTQEVLRLDGELRLAKKLQSGD
jgi:hypothetical protein